jgi:hypothetical protein
MRCEHKLDRGSGLSGISQCMPTGTGISLCTYFFLYTACTTSICNVTPAGLACCLLLAHKVDVPQRQSGG